MRVQCDQCGASYTLPSERVAAGRRLQFQCRQCQHRIVVQVPETVVQPSVAAAVPVARVLWFVSTAAGQQQRMDSEGVKAAIAQGTLSRDTWVWRKGMAEWLRAGDCADLQPWLAPQPVAGASGEAQPTLAMDVPLPASPAVIAASAPVQQFARPAVVSGSHIAGTASIHKGAGHNTDQRAMAMPVVRVPGDEGTAELAADALRSKPVVTPVQRGLASQTGGRSRAAAADSPVAESSDSSDERRKWSPATDTYTGLRARLTRKVDDGARNAAVEWADALNRREVEVETLQQQVRVWKRLAIAASAAVVLLGALALLMAWKWRQAEQHSVAVQPTAQP